MFAKRASMIHVLAFERELQRLIELAGVNAFTFFAEFPTIREAKWEAAKANFAAGKPTLQGAGEWFAKCIAPHIEGVTV